MLLVAGRRLGEAVVDNLALAAPRANQIVTFQEDVQNRHLPVTLFADPVEHHNDPPFILICLLT